MKNKNLVKGFKANMKRVIKHGSLYPYLYAFIALLLVSLVFFMGVSFDTGNYAGNMVLQLFLVVILVSGVVFSFPFFYGVALSVANDSRFSDENKVKIKDVLAGYKVNNSIYNFFSLLLKSILASIIIEFLIGLIIVPILYGVYPNIIQGYFDFQNALLNAGPNEEVFLESFLEASEIITLDKFVFFSQTTAAFFVVVYLGREIRKSERVFFACNSLLTGNKINVAVGMNANFIKKFVLPTVKKEHRELNIKINYVGYIVFTVVFCGMVTLSYYCFGSYGLMLGLPFSLLMACLSYIPFQYYTRVFDCLFYIAYEDTMITRLPDAAKDLVLTSREQMKQYIPKGQEETNSDVKETPVDSETPEDVKVGEKIDDVIDYTSKKEDNDESRKE